MIDNSNKIHFIHMETAKLYSKLSKAVKKKVGAILVKNDRIISIGYNGTPSGFDNTCEVELEDGSLRTKDIVLHAESNAITKVAKSGESSEGSDLYCTLSPCMECSKLIAQSGIKRVFFNEFYRNVDGIKEVLKPSKVEVYHIGDCFVMSLNKYIAKNLEFLKEWKEKSYDNFIHYFNNVDSLSGDEECIRFIENEIKEFFKNEEKN